jgi:hypothetical protein
MNVVIKVLHKKTISYIYLHPFISYPQPLIQNLRTLHASALLFSMGLREKLDRIGFKERNPDGKPMNVEEVRTDVFKLFKNDKHAYHAARVYHAPDGHALTVEAKRYGTRLECAVTPGDKYKNDPTARRERIGTSRKTFGQIFESGMPSKQI